MTTIGSDAVHVSHARDRHRLLWEGGTTFDVVLDGAGTGNTLALLDQHGVRGDGSPLHVHRTEAEVFYVLEGGITAWAGDEVHDLGEGGAVYLPAGRPHAVGVRTEHARMLIVTVPSGFADFVRAAGVPVDGAPPTTWEYDIGRLMAAAPAHGIEIVGPPPSMRSD
jgi:quercetin dioxygenase-like cupin family protein